MKSRLSSPKLWLAFAATIAVTGLVSCSTSRKAVQTVSASSSKPVQLILDSDFGSSTDDLFALMMIHNYMDEGLVDLKGIIVDREGEKNAGLVDIFNTYYGHPDIPVGLERDGVKNPRCFIPYNGICDLKDESGAPLFKRTFDESECPEGYRLYRQLLSKADDKSISVVAIGFATTLAHLFESGPDEYSSLSGVELFGRKVKAVYIQSGRFEAGDSLCGYNMRAAAKQSAIFYDRLPKNVDIVMSPSNIGDNMDYVPADVLSDLSSTDLNPIKTVYTNYTCDTGQRMWDTNCLVNAVLGDEQYNLSPRGWGTFVDKGQDSQMLFAVDPEGNARYQIPGDSYFNQEKLMEIRRHTRINRYPSAYTVEAPQPQLIREDAAEWVKPRLNLLVDKYLGSAGNKLDPDDVRMLFRPLGYTGPNARDYTEAESILTDAIYKAMIAKAVNGGNKTLVIVTGPPSSGKTTVVKALNLKGAGLVYDAALTGPGKLDQAINLAKTQGMEKITLVMVYNDILTCFNNTISKGQATWNYTAVDYLVNAYRDNIGKLEAIRSAYPDLEIIPVDCSGNKGPGPASLEEALGWKFEIDEDDFRALLTSLKDEIDNGGIDSSSLAGVTHNLLNIRGIGESNIPLAKEIVKKVEDITQAYKMR